MLSDANAKLHNLMLTKWLTQDLFSIQWWGIVGFVILSYILCFSLMDKTRLTKTILYGSLISVFSVVIDAVGTSFNLWLYNVNFFPMIPSIFIYDITALPMYFMLIFQRTKSWRTYLVWILGASAFMGFVFTPLMVKIGIGKLIHSNYFISFLLISITGIMGKVGTSLIFYVEERYVRKREI